MGLDLVGLEVEAVPTLAEFGDPAQRSAERRQRDLENGYVS